MAYHYYKIKTIYKPQNITDEDFTLQDIKGVITIENWNTAKLGVKPTLASIDAQIGDVELEVKMMWKKIRKERNQLLKDSDYMILADAPVDETQKQEWTTYRQALRDIPQDYDSPDEVVYPDKPK
jgi:hypothetical protein